MELKKRTTSALLWSATDRVLQQVWGFITVLIFYRLLSPREFGLLGFATVVIAFLAIFQNFGLGLSIIQGYEITKEQISGLYWINLFFSVFLAIVVILVAPWVAKFFKEPIVTPILTVLAFIFPLDAFSMVHASLLEKELQFKKITIINSFSIIAAGAVGIIAAVLKCGVWALVLNQVGLSAFKTLLLISVVKWSPLKIIPFKQLKKQVSFSVFAQISAVLNFCARNVDDILIGKVLGSKVLGTYQLSYRLMLWPLQKVSHVIGRVMFPTLSLIQEDKERVKSIYLRVIGTIALITFPMVFGLFVISSSAIPYLLGEKWKAVVPIFQVLCVLGILQSISASQGWIYLSQRRTDLHFKVHLVAVSIIIISFVIGIHYGVMGVAVCYTLACSLVIPFQLYIALRLINVSLRELIHKIIGALICAFTMALIVFGVGRIMAQHWHQGVALGIQIAAGVISYFLLVRLFKLKSYEEVKMLIIEQWKKGEKLDE
jgi:O-antigen/teichoic acid export membrane protein